MSRAKKMFIQDAIHHPGALHKALHIPQGQKIPAKKLTKATHSKNLLLKRRAILAQTLRKMPRHHGSR
jgi:hypothetical protein